MHQITVSNSGFSLLEIMVVLLILSMIMGIGVGAFSKVGSGPDMALGRIKDVVRASKFHSVREKAPSAVRVDSENNTVSGLGWKRVGVWHFEDSIGGQSIGFPHETVVGSYPVHKDGVIGNCLDLTVIQGRKVRSDVYIPSAPSLDSVNGVTLEFFVFLKNIGRRTLLSKGAAYSIMITEDGCLGAKLRLVTEDDEPEAKGVVMKLETLKYKPPLNRWVRLGLQFDGYAMIVSADGIERVRESFKKRKRLVLHNNEPVMIGSKEFNFDGRLDELRISAAVLGDESPFHDYIRIEGKPFTIHFDSKGCLDKDYHTQPLTIQFIHGESKSYKVTVGLMGEVR